MSRNRMIDMLMMRDGRNPYSSLNGYMRDGRRMRRRGDRGMDYGYNMEYRNSDNRQYGSMDGNYPYSQQYNARGRRDYESGRQYDMAGRNYGDMRGGRDGHYPMSEGKTYFPIEAMGTFNGYYGTPEQDYRGGMDYGYPMYDMGDYGETLTKEELEHWKNKLMQEVDEKDKHFFTKEMIGQKAKSMGAEMKDYNEEELVVATLMAYTDYSKAIKPYVGSNMDIYIALGKAWLEDKDVAVKGAEKLCVYYDCVVR